ncbi:zinc finger protein [Apiospora arundinis]
MLLRIQGLLFALKGIASPADTDLRTRTWSPLLLAKAPPSLSIAGVLDFLNHRLPRGAITTSPLPLLMQLQPPIRKAHRCGTALPGHQLPLEVDVVVPHVQGLVVVAHRGDQGAPGHAAAGVLGPDDVALLVVVETGLAVDFAVGGVGHGPEGFVVVEAHGDGDVGTLNGPSSTTAALKVE